MSKKLSVTIERYGGEAGSQRWGYELNLSLENQIIHMTITSELREGFFRVHEGNQEKESIPYPSSEKADEYMRKRIMHEAKRFAEKYKAKIKDYTSHESPRDLSSRVVNNL